MKRKIVLIGIDGGDWKVIEPLLKKGKLPWFRKIMKGGLWGILYCNILGIFQKTEGPFKERLYDPVYWTALSTGLTPKKHGINGYTEKGPDGIEVPISRKKKKKPTIWEILAHQGSKIGVIGWLANYPPPKLDNYTVSTAVDPISYFPKGITKRFAVGDFKLPGLISSLPYFTYPTWLGQELEMISPDKDVAVFVEKLLHSRYTSRVIPNLLYDNLYLKWTKYLLSRYPQPDFLTVCLHGIHYLSHLFWDCLEVEARGFRGIVHHRRRKRYGNIVEEYYQYLDKKISEVSEMVNKDSIVIVVSDHGMSASSVTKRFIHMDLIYEKLGFLRFKDKDRMIDWKNTQVYDNRYPWGLFSIKKGYIKDENPYKVFKRLKRSLQAIETKKREQLFPGIVFSNRDNSFLITPNYKAIKYNTKIIIENKVYPISKFVGFIPHYSLHANEGMVIISGRGIPKGRTSSWISLLDIAPTILYLSGIKYKGMDGEVIAEVKKGGL